MRRRKPVPPVQPTKPPRAPKTPGGYPPPAASEIRTHGGILRLSPSATTEDLDRIEAAFRAPLKSPAELEAEHVDRDLAARAQLAETLRPFDAPKRRELLTWAIRELVDAPTAPTPKEPGP